MMYCSPTHNRKVRIYKWAIVDFDLVYLRRFDHVNGHNTGFKVIRMISIRHTVSNNYLNIFDHPVTL